MSQLLALTAFRKKYVIVLTLLMSNRIANHRPNFFIKARKVHERHGYEIKGAR